MVHFLFLITLLIAAFNTDWTAGISTYCTEGCNGSPNEVYEEVCCNPQNFNNVVIIDKSIQTVQYVFCPATPPEMCNYFSICKDVLNNNPSATTGYYDIQLTNGSIISVYCDMEGDNCDGEGGWTRIAYVNMAEPGATCPEGLTAQSYSNINHDLCGRANGVNECQSAYFSSFGIRYTKVCGQARGYQFGHLDGIFDGSGIDDAYVEGISITHGSNPRQHIWTYGGGYTEEFSNWDDCPCNSGSNKVIPSFIGTDYYCESGPGTFGLLYASDPLWDGNDCNFSEGPCCTNPRMPWFVRNINSNDNIEMRVCARYPPFSDVETPFDIFELYIK